MTRPVPLPEEGVQLIQPASFSRRQVNDPLPELLISKDLPRSRPPATEVWKSSSAAEREMTASG